MIPGVGRQRQEDQEVKAILAYMTRPAWAT